MAAVYKYLAGLVFLAVIVQIGFAGYGAFSVAKDVDERARSTRTGSRTSSACTRGSATSSSSSA